MMINSTPNLVINDVFLIADSSPLIALAGVKRLNLLPRLYSRVIAPSAVIDEILAGGQKASGLNFLDRASWLEHWTLEQTPELISIALGSGETEAILLAKQLSDSRFLLDDKKFSECISRAISFLKGRKFLLKMNSTYGLLFYLCMAFA